MASPNKKTRYDFEKDINEIIQKELWSDLSTLLQDGGLSDAEQAGAVEAASKHCAESIFLSLISPHCTSSQLHSALPHLASRGLWQAVGHVLQRGVSTALLTWSIHQAARQCIEQELLSFILPHCAEDQLDSVLAVLVKRGLWRAVGLVIQQVQGTTRSWAIEKACQEAGEDELVVFILPACSAVEIACALVGVVVRGLWRAVGKMLQRGVGDTLCIWTLQEVFKNAKCKQIRNDILPYCTRDYLNRLMSYIISKGRWNDVDKLMQCVKKNISNSRLQIWTVRGTELEKQMLQLVAKRRWRDVGAMLTEGVGDSQYEWLIHTACLDAQEEDFVEHVLPHCSDRLLDSVLTVIVGPRAWEAVKDVLEQHVRDSKIRWAVLEACNICDEDVIGEGSDADLFMEDCGFNDPKEFIVYGLLPECANDKLCSKLWILADRYLQRHALRVLERGVKECKKRWAIQESYDDVKKGYSCDFFRNEDSADDQVDDLLVTLVDSADDQVDDLLVTLVKEHLSRAIEEAPNQSDGDSETHSALGNSCVVDWEEKQLEKDNFSIISDCGYDTINDTLKTLVEGRLLLSFGDALGQGVSDSVKRLLMEKACKTYLIDVHDDVAPAAADDDGNFVDGGNVGDDGKDDDEADNLDCNDLLDTNGDDDDGNFVDGGNVGDDGKDDDEADNFDWNDLLDTNGDDDDDGNFFDGCNVDDDGKDDDEADNFDCNDLLDANGDDDDDGNDDDDGTCFSCKLICSYLKNHFDSDEFVDESITNSIQPHCENAHSSVLPRLAKQKLFNSVRDVLKQQESNTELCKNVLLVFENANETLIETILSCYVYDNIRSELETLASRRLWKVFLMLLHRFTIDTLHSWANGKDCSGPKEIVFWDMVSNPCGGVKELSHAQWRSVTWSDLQYSLKDSLDWDTLLCEVLCEALLGTVREIWLSGREKEIVCPTAVGEARSVTEDINLHLNKTLTGCKTITFLTFLPCVHWLCQKYAGKTQSVARQKPTKGEAVQRHGGTAENSSFCMHYMSTNPKGAIKEEDRYGKNGSSSSPLFQLHFLKYLTHDYYMSKAWTQMTDAVLVVLTTTPVVPGIQSIALRIMMREKRWDVIRHACLSYVCEQDRRQMFQAAVKQRQWGAVKRWADYSLYDDQRLWALGEAKGEKRWDVYLTLAGHGLNEGERMGVLHRVAMHADWELVRHMLNTVADVSYMKELLTNTRTTRQARTMPAMCHQRIEELTEFEEALKNDTNTLKTLKTAEKRGKWQVVLYKIRHKPDLQNPRHALKAAVSSKAWQTVIQLVRLETDVTRRDSLFRDMVRQQQWAVCRELLDQGVGDQLCVESLSDLIEHRQWTLVAMVMRCPMSEERRTETMYRALMMREGSVVWQCINSLQRPLSSEQRENIFQLAFKREVWQAVKPLVEIRDETGIRHRDTALLEAIEQHRWDVVDHCLRHHADINMKDDDGHTPIHRMARKQDWEAVKELAVRDGDPNLLDGEGLSVLHRAIKAKEWNVVKLLIQFHGDIHCPSGQYQQKTALIMLIDARQIDVIQYTFMWCVDQWKGVNYEGETTLHAACLSGCPGILHDLIARRVDPLAVTSKGLSALCYAVLCRDCPQKMVAECIKLGFSTHQPHCTGVVERHSSHSYFSETEKPKLLTCPMMLAVMRGLPVVTHMLYESGACSNRQLVMLTMCLDTLTLTVPTTRQALESEFNMLWRSVHESEFNMLWRSVHGNYGHNSFDTVMTKKSADYLRQMSSTPRSLVSTCRLVISRCLTLSMTRPRDIALLPLSPMLKNYLMFTDLTDPDCMGH